MSLVDLSGVTPQFFLLAVIFILLIGSLFSFGVLRFFQKRVRDSLLSFGLAIAAFVVMCVKFFGTSG
ncbi:hypothetical protein [Paenibacillus gansuensis]|uniref:Uncharacterized protein n=1 Tax=Paenibacillus gansuensis TaxID=306542 RepID=A0ABW5PB66_9BACL